MTSPEFVEKALQLQALQTGRLGIYKDFCKILNRTTPIARNLESLPYLPIGFFKTHKVFDTALLPKTVFTSSGTTGVTTSKHYIADIEGYNKHAQGIFEDAYGSVCKYAVMALLPSYQEQGNSSLVSMVAHFIKLARPCGSGFYLHQDALLHTALMANIQQEIPTVLFGVSYALLDFCESFTLPPNSALTIIETGGMKGRKKEIIREQLHRELVTSFGVTTIHSEYGMTELLSQCYSAADGRYHMNKSMKVVVRDPNDPFAISLTGKGALNVIDLANTNSCAFIATDDQGEVFEDGTFTVSGRMDNSDIRGCSQMAL
jgi:hypothetical protein